MNNELVIDVKNSEISIALLEDKVLVELSKEKSNKQFTVGDIYLGKVKKIMAGLNAAFVDIGYERDAFLHYLDLGPQFLSLSHYMQLAYKPNTKLPPVHDFKCLPDINKNGKITEVLTTGQNVLVQVAKEPISTKGPRITSEVSIPGRYIVLIPFSDKVSVSQKIKSSEEKKRLKRLLLSIKPNNYGIIVRTVAEGKTAETLHNELNDLINKWENSLKDIVNIEPPALIIGELNRTSAILRDILNSSFNNIYINDLPLYKEIQNIVSTYSPERLKIVKLFNSKLPIFEQFGIEKQIKSLFGKTVTIKSGAYLIIEHTEALHVIDVNSGNRSRKGNNQEANALEVNLLAAEEIARQLRLRDMGGIIVIDFIDMHDFENRKTVYVKMKEFMANDRARHNILPLSKFGLMQITRQRVRPEMNIKTIETCPTCAGTGEVMPSVLLTDEISTKLRYLSEKHEKAELTLKVHPYVEAFIKKGIYSMYYKWKFNVNRKLKLKSDYAYGLLEYSFFDKSGEKLIT